MLRHLLCLCLLLLQFLAVPCAMAAPERWKVVDGPYSTAAARSIYDWIDTQSTEDPTSPISNLDRNLLRNLVKGSLIWAYSYGNSFNPHDFLLHFSNRDETIEISYLDTGGLLFSLNSAFFKISTDLKSAKTNVFPENNKAIYPRKRWFASICTSSSEIMFYFSVVGPFSSWPMTSP